MRIWLHPGDDLLRRGVYPPDRFAVLLERERARADRLGEEFSLLAMAVPRGAGERDHLAQWLQRLQTRLRITDDIGWLAPHCLGVLLPSTPPSGAWTVVSDLFAASPSDVQLPQVRVYSYPSHWSLEEDHTQDRPRQLAGIDQPIHAMEALFVRPTPFWKRTLDLCGALSGLVVLLPLLGLIALGIRLNSPGPVLFVQERSGLGGKRFSMYKFRTMSFDAEARRAALVALNEQDGPAFKLTHDPRITPPGRLLRKLSLDELPQLWNVVRGEMSLVGPRPLPCYEAERCEGWQRRRLDVAPGLTCIWQVRGRSVVSFPDWIRMDLRYIRRRTLLHDLRLIVETVPAVLLGKGGK